MESSVVSSLPGHNFNPAPRKHGGDHQLWGTLEEFLGLPQANFLLRLKLIYYQVSNWFHVILSWFLIGSQTNLYHVLNWFLIRSRTKLLLRLKLFRTEHQTDVLVCLNRACRRNRSKNRKHTCATLYDALRPADWSFDAGFFAVPWGSSFPRYCKNPRIYRLSSWPQSRLIGWHKRVMALIGLFL